MDSTLREESMKLVHVHFKNIKNFFSDASGPPIDLVVVLELRAISELGRQDRMVLMKVAESQTLD